MLDQKFVNLSLCGQRLKEMVRITKPTGSIFIHKFIGTGTTAVAVIKNPRRKYIGMDVDSKYVEIIA